MEQTVILILFLIVLFVIGFPIWVIVRISGLSRDVREMRQQLAALQKRPAESPAPPVETVAAAAAPVAPPVVAAPPLPVTPPPVITNASVLPEAPPPLSRISPTPLPPPPLPPQRADGQAPAGPFNWEVFMGTKFLSWLGAIAAFLAVAYFLKYSLDHDLISKSARAAMGFVFGAGMIAGGLLAVRKKYPILGHALCAAGVVSLYGVTFACRALYAFPFFDGPAALALMVLITAAAFVLAVRLDGKFIAILGLLGGFATPPMLSTGVDNPLGLFGYVALLNAGLYAVALRKRWDFLVPLAAFCTAAMQIGWAGRFLRFDNDVFEAVVVCLAFNVLFLAGYCVARRMKREGPMHARSVAALVLVSFGFAAHLGMDTVAAWIPWLLLGFVFLADACVLAVAALDRRGTDSGWIPSVAGLAVFVILAAWTAEHVDANAGLLPWALGGYFVFAVMHTAFPLALARLRPGANAPGARTVAQFFAPLALVLAIVPVAGSGVVPWLVWPAILLIDLVAILCAAITRSIAGLAGALVLTLATAAVWVWKIPSGVTHAPLALLLTVGGFATLFFAASLWLGRRRADADKRGGPGMAALPALSSLLPFALIVMMEARMTLVNPTPVFGLGLLLTVLVLGLAKMLKNEWLPACALAGMLAVCYVWRASIGGVISNPEQQIAATTALGWFIGFHAIFAAFPFAFRSAFSDTRGAWLASAASGVLFFPLVFRMIKAFWPNDVMGLIPVAFAVPALLSLAAVLRLDPPEHPRRMGRAALFGGVALLFITLIFPVQFSRQWITIAWALEGAALLWLYRRVPHRALPWAGVGLLVVAFARLALNPAVLGYHVRGDMPVLNWYLYAYGIAAACLFAGAGLLKTAGQNRFNALAAKSLPALGVILLFLLLNIEIADFFTEPGRPALALTFSGNFARDMTYTIAWALFALALLVAGIARKLRVSRYAALGLLAIVALKLALHDLASLETLYRVAALFAVAVIMILASFLYQKYIAPRPSSKQ